MQPEQQPTTHNQHPTNFLIVGQGLAGSLLAWELHQKGFSVAVVDEGLPHTSSKIAAGMFNPINTKRFTVSASAEQSITEALLVYQSIEKELHIDIIHHQNIYNVFGNNKEVNDYSAKLDHPFFKQYTNENPIPLAHIQHPFGAFEVGLSGWIDIHTMLASIRYFVASKHILLKEVFDYKLLKQTVQGWKYKHIEAEHIVFCEGFKGNNNPFFTELHIIPCKGDVLEFEAPLLTLTKVVKKGIYIVSMGNGKFKCGSTYQWENNDATPLAQDKEELTQKIAEVITVPFTVTAHYAAIRPTTKTRETIITKHAIFPNMYALNGLGTKGVINGVKCVKEFLHIMMK
jgi:glycine/D-amino acid oxidase-like deaminating enzyme